MAKDESAIAKVADMSSEETARKAKLLKAGIGIGIGSAAIVAALLYANHSKMKSKP
jgi:hypothetical protein